VKHTSPETTVKKPTIGRPRKQITRKAPTDKQRKAIAIAATNGGNISRAMVEAGYSPATAKTPQKLTESEYVQELMHAVGLTDVYGFEVLKDGMGASKAVVMAAETDSSFVDVQPDYAVRHKYLETFFKVRGVGRGDGTTPSIHFHQHSEGNGL
jgi:leucyl aminopeptidase